MLLRAKNITKSYLFSDKSGKDNFVFKNISFEIKQGEFVCIFGKSGAGKTTLLNIVAGLISVDSGELTFSPHRPRLAYVFQEDRLFPWMTVSDNLSLMLNKNKNSVNKYLKLVGLEKKNNDYPLSLSGGERQRVSLARALFVEPEILLMDEPFSHLDELTAQEIRMDLKSISLGKKMTVIFVTHNPIEAAFFADKIIVLSKKLKNISKVIKVRKIHAGREGFYKSFIYKASVKKLVNKLIGSLS